MALRIIPATEPIHVSQINLVIYAAPGLGKSTLGFTADRPLMLDFDKGAHRAKNRKDSVRPTCWEDVAHITADDVRGFGTLIVDTAGRALDTLSADIIRRNAKMGRGGALTLQGFGLLKVEFAAWLKMVNGFGLDVVLIAHMDEQRSGDEIIERLDVQGGSKGEIYKAADAMARLQIKEGRRVLTFNPTDAAFGKNPAQLPELTVPPTLEAPAFLADTIAQIKASLNAMSDEQMAAQQEQAAWRVKLDAATTTAAFNALLPEIKAAPRLIQAMANHEAKRRGWRYEGEAYVDPNANAATAADADEAAAA